MGKLRGVSLSPAEAESYVGRTGVMRADRKPLSFEVWIREVRGVYGRLEFRVEPVYGYGTAWVSAGKVEIHEEVGL